GIAQGIRRPSAQLAFIAFGGIGSTCQEGVDERISALLVFDRIDELLKDRCTRQDIDLGSGHAWIGSLILCMERIVDALPVKLAALVRCTVQNVSVAGRNELVSIRIGAETVGELFGLDRIDERLRSEEHTS